MKKIFAILLVVSLAVAMIACSGTNTEDNKDNTSGADISAADKNAEANLPENAAGGEKAPVNDTAKDEVADSDESETVDEPKEDVVVDLPETDAGDEPAAMPGEDEIIDDMPTLDVPEVDTPEVDTPEVDAPEVDAPEVDAPSSEATIDDLYALADKLYEGIDPENMPFVGTMELTEENFEYSAFVPYKSSYLAVENMPMMGSQPHSVVIVKADSQAEAKALADEMAANANPRKWICVQARSVMSASKGEYAILVMTSVEVMPNDKIDEETAEKMSNEQSEERAQIIIDNFMAAVK